MGNDRQLGLGNGVGGAPAVPRQCSEVCVVLRCWLLVECLSANCVLDGVVYDDGECNGVAQEADCIRMAAIGYRVGMDDSLGIMDVLADTTSLRRTDARLRVEMMAIGYCVGIVDAGRWRNVYWPTACWMELCMTMGNVGLGEWRSWSACSAELGKVAGMDAFMRGEVAIGAIRLDRCWLLVECLLANQLRIG
ncbi:hypothetical protein EMWEY_00037520 [Eimeria maxima]|uniref:Uncharacterized protein n=1 Tax=Eimeria maxima TaxID=5804 RepID=U6MA48_EIMMA|nr:hypothetical protein EMWEY_00037520 [Eimeria maxima]CDJ61062.1 hypothetical protein EMWEY_00037520 [Eimeria maxima]